MRYIPPCVTRLGVVATFVFAAAGATRHATAQFNPNVPGYEASVYALVPDAVRMAFAPDGSLYLGRNPPADCCSPARILRVPPGGGVAEFYSNSAIPDPDAVAFDATGSISGVPGSVIVGGLDSLYVVRPDRSSFTLYTSSTLGNPSDMVVDASGDLVLTSDTSKSLVRYRLGIGASVIASSGQPYTVARDAAGNFYSGCWDGAIRKYGPNGGSPTTWATGVGAFSIVAVGPGGEWGTDLYVLSYASGELRRYSAPNVYTVVGTGFLPGNAAYDMEFGPGNALYIVDAVPDRVWRVTCRPYLTSHPTSIPTCPADAAMFEVSFGGIGPIAIQWQWRPQGHPTWLPVTDGENLDPTTGLPAFDAGGATAGTLVVNASPENTIPPGGDRREFRADLTNTCATVISNTALWTICPADFNCDGFVNGDDFDSFAAYFESGDLNGDFNHDGFVNGDDFDSFAEFFEAGC